LNARDLGKRKYFNRFSLRLFLEIQNVRFNEDTYINEVASDASGTEGFVYNQFPQNIAEIMKTDSDDLKNSNKWLKNLSKTDTKELEIPVPKELIKVIEVVNNNNLESNSMTDETVAVATLAPIEVYQNIFLTIDYLINPKKLNFGSISMYKARPNPKNQIRYIQLIGSSFDGMGRYLMPCVDGERLANWDLEYSVKSGEWQDVFDRIHLVSSGVLCRQVSVLFFFFFLSLYFLVC
jgi:hypothetical protein